MRQISDTAARQQRKDREAHLDIGHAERIPGKPAVFSKVRLNKARMGFQLAVKVRFLHPLPKRFAQRLCEAADLPFGHPTDMRKPEIHQGVARFLAARSCAELMQLARDRDIPLHALPQT